MESWPRKWNLINFHFPTFQASDHFQVFYSDFDFFFSSFRLLCHFFHYFPAHSAIQLPKYSSKFWNLVLKIWYVYVGFRGWLFGSKQANRFAVPWGRPPLPRPAFFDCLCRVVASWAFPYPGWHGHWRHPCPDNNREVMLVRLYGDSFWSS